MKNSAENQIYRAALYVRLSKEDGDKEESNSIVNQKELIRNYLAGKPDIKICGEYVDDGFSGASFERPAFSAMMEEIKAGRINCIVVKDLSRFGRNYLDAGEYIERIFPFLRVRFIAINDNYDSSKGNSESDGLMIPFKNLINEAYCRDISIKIRSQLEIKRRKGDFIGSFAVYGYRKDPENKNHLVADDFAADVVRDIFHWKLEGVSAGDIADKLNTDGILSPMEYKKSQGLCFVTPFCVNACSMWSAAAVLRILKNPVYAGVLAQGKSTTPSYKVKRRVEKSPEDWAVVEGAHEAIIDKDDFAVVQKVLKMDTRTSPGSQAVELFSGMIFCGECGAPMVRKTIPSGSKRYIYYVCEAHKNEKTCFSHSMSNDRIKEVILKALQTQIRAWTEVSDLAKLANQAFSEKKEIRKLEKRFGEKQKEIEKYQRLLSSLYESLAEGMIDREEYAELKRNYRKLLEESKRQTEEIRREMCRMTEEGTRGQRWMNQFEKHQNVMELDRMLLVFLIEKIFICRNQRLEIVYSWKDEMKGKGQ